METNPLMFGLNNLKNPDPFTIVIFGASGDLTRKKLIPALYSLFIKGYLSEFTVVGFARRPWDDREFRGKVKAMLEVTDFQESTEDLKELFLEKVFYISSTFEDLKGYKEITRRFPAPENRLFYLSTPPQAYETIIANLGTAGLQEEKAGFSRLIIEKPFGRDLDSARELNRQCLKVFPERQIYRIDHYLGKETVQNIMVFRFGNGLFEPIWNNQYIESVQITVSEDIGIGTRGNYYEKSGAMRDIVQNHLLQILCLVAMSPPNDLAPDSIRDEKVKVLKSIRPITEENVMETVVRGQYSPGVYKGEAVPGYRQENDVDPQSLTETYVAMKIFLDSWKWAGVPFFIRCGKRLARKLTEVSIQFKSPLHKLFEKEHMPHVSHTPNTLTLLIQPEEGVILNFNAKIPGFNTEMRPVNMGFAYGSSFGRQTPEAYERLILDALVGDSTLFTRNDEIEYSWEFITKILKLWEDPRYNQVAFYKCGSSGPEEAKGLLAPYNTKWRKM